MTSRDSAAVFAGLLRRAAGDLRPPPAPGRPAAPQATRGMWAADIEAGRWARLEAETGRELHAQQQRLRRLRHRLPELRRRLDLADSALLLAPALPRPAARDDAALRRELLARGLTPAQAQQALDLRGSTTAAGAAQAARSAVLGQAQGLARQARQHQRTAAAALHTRAVCRLQQAAPAADPGQSAAAARRSLAAAWRALAAALADRSPAAAAIAASTLGATAQDACESLLAAAAAAAGPSPTTAEVVRAAAVADLIRAALTAQAAAVAIWWALPAPAGPDLNPWWTPPAAPPLPPAPRRTPIARLLGSGHADDSPVAVAGTLAALEIRHRGRKAVSVGTLTDPAGREVQLVLPYIKLDSTGLVPGAPAVVGGTWHPTSPETGGPALHVGTRSRSQQADQSLHDWAVWLLRPVYQPVPHGLAVSAAWITGIDGPANPVRYGVWYDRKAA